MGQQIEKVTGTVSGKLEEQFPKLFSSYWLAELGLEWFTSEDRKEERARREALAEKLTGREIQ